MMMLAVAYAFNVLALQLSWLTRREDGRSFKVLEALQAGPGKGFRHRDYGQNSGPLSRLRCRCDRFPGAAQGGELAFGRVLRAIRENPFRAEALGYRIVLPHALASCISAAGATLPGALFALWLRYVGPDTASPFRSRSTFW